jgi:mono/diheme cytochrome c family protein
MLRSVRAPGGRARSILGLLVAATFCGSLVAAAAQELFTPTQDPVAGARLFESKGCVQCHAINGAGGKDGPDLGRLERTRSFYELTAAMWNHLPRMAERIRASAAARPYLTPNEMSDLMAFLGPRALDDAAPQGAGGPARGRRLLADKRCLDCHSLSPPRGKAARSLDALKGVDSPWTVMATMWNHAFLMTVTTDDRKVAWPRLSPDEMADLVAFMRAHAYGGRDH